MSDPFTYYVCALTAVFITGLSKGGFAGIGVLAMPLLSLSVDPLMAAGIMLPILIVQDFHAVTAFRRHFDATVLKVMLPGMAAGVLTGFAFAEIVNTTLVLGAVGVISIIFGTQKLLNIGASNVINPGNNIIGAFLGIVSGFTSQIAHAGAPPYQLWVLPKQLPRDTLVGTTAICFTALNLMKVPAFIALGQLSATNLTYSLYLLPFALLSTFIGTKIVKKIEPDRFYFFIYFCLVVLGFKLVFEAIAS